MKKTLMAGTALVASGVLLAAASGTASAQAKKAERIKLGLSGYAEQWFGYSDEDNTTDAGLGGVNDLDQKSDSEIYIKGSTTLDNGIQVGVVWEIEGDGDATSSAAGSTSDNTGRFDEAFLFVSGSFGRINLGQEDTASELMGYGNVTVGPVGTNKTDASDWIRKPSGNGTNESHNMDLGLSDRHGVSYYTPRIAGFQVGASYHPNSDENSDAAIAESAVAHNGMSAAVNYVGKIGDASLAAYAGYATVERADGGTVHDDTGFGVGLNVGFGGFTFGGSYIREDTTSTDTTWGLSVRYKMGMNAFSVAYQNSEDTAGTSSDTDDETKLFTVGYERTLGPGVTFGASIAKVDYDGEGTGTSEDNDGFMVVTGIKLDF